jgi:hypothetical protein
MQRRATISALLLVGVGVVLGTTVFRADLAEATGLAQSVTVNNTTNNPVPVKEQNLDGQNIRVHEEGTAAVRSADEEISLTKTVFECDEFKPVVYTVPTGKTFVVKYAGASGFAQGASSVSGFIAAGSDFVPLVFIRQEDSLWRASDAVEYAFAAGSELRFIGGFLPLGLPYCSAQVALGGYLQPAP